jgi:hypothetical protein
MKSRICFYFAAVVALVLFVASLSSHATERRDPLILPDAQQTQSATHSSHAKNSRKKPSARNAQKQKNSTASADKSSDQGANAPFEGKDQAVSESSSGSSKNARTSAGK